MTTLEKLREIRERADKTPSSPMERTDFIYNSKIDTQALVDALEVALEHLRLILLQRDNFVEAAAENSIHFAADAIAEIEQIMTGERE